MARNLMEAGDLRKELDTLKSDLSKVRRDIGDVVGAMVDTGRRSGEGVSEQVRSEFGKRLHDLNDTYGRMRVNSVKTVRRAKRGVSEHPFLSLMGAVFVGSVVASIAEWMWFRQR